ncbi:hypothetical protein TruAng_000398 [Truncatella angustata]|nr:hypothetical protein TruAng_000398 [Truncatella angustata]
MTNGEKVKGSSEEPEDHDWSAKLERDLLLFLFAVGKVVDNRVTVWNVVSALISVKGYTKTWNAIKSSAFGGKAVSLATSHGGLSSGASINPPVPDQAVTRHQVPTDGAEDSLLDHNPLVDPRLQASF